MANISNIDKLIQFALLVAGEEDDFQDRQLGPIHLIKYVYLADLAFAHSKNGQTFTGVEWQFYKFGPWAQVVNERIEPALLCIDAEKKTFPSSFDDRDDWVRWQAVDESHLSKLDQDLPLIITSNLRRNVHRFGKATPELLSFVYSTEPMRNAAPNEFLNFSDLKKHLHHQRVEERHDPMSIRQKKKLKSKMDDLRSKSIEKLAVKRKKRLVAPLVTPRYDNVYLEGLEWLDSLAGEKITLGEKNAVFSDSIWKSPSRTSDDFSN